MPEVGLVIDAVNEAVFPFAITCTITLVAVTDPLTVGGCGLVP